MRSVCSRLALRTPMTERNPPMAANTKPRKMYKDAPREIMMSSANALTKSIPCGVLLCAASVSIYWLFYRGWLGVYQTTPRCCGVDDPRVHLQVVLTRRHRRRQLMALRLGRAFTPTPRAAPAHSRSPP